MFSNVVIVGRLGSDPEAKYFDSGKNKATVSVAVDRPNKEKTTDWHRVEIWGKAAESLCEHAKKGDVVAFTNATLEYSEYEKDGVKHKMAIVAANAWRFCGGKKAQDDQEGSRAGGRASQAQADDSIPF